MYREAVTAFYTGLSAMQTTQEVLAREKFDRVVALVPQEPAGWADLGLLLLRQQELDQGAQHLARAAALAPESAEIQRLQALAESRRGNLAEAIRHWRRALELDPDDPQAAYALALDTERQGGRGERCGGPAHSRAAHRAQGESGGASRVRAHRRETRGPGGAEDRHRAADGSLPRMVAGSAGSTEGAGDIGGGKSESAPRCVSRS